MTQKVTDEQARSIRDGFGAFLDGQGRYITEGELASNLLDARAALAEREADLEATRAVNAALVRESNGLRAECERLRGDARTLATFVASLNSPGLNETVATRRILSAPAPPEPATLDSPNFVPDRTKAFVAGGMKRVNRHAPPPEPACECGGTGRECIRAGDEDEAVFRPCSCRAGEGGA